MVKQSFTPFFSNRKISGTS